MRLRIITSRPPGYRRGGLVIGGPAAPTIIARGEIEPGKLLVLLEDRNLSFAISWSEEGDDWTKLDESDRLEAILATKAAQLRVDPGSPPSELAAETDPGDWFIAGLGASLSVTDEQAGFEPTPFHTPSQAASGAEGDPDGAAASAGEPEAKATEAQASVAVDPAGTSDASAASGEASREQADDASADRKDAPDVGKKPEDAVQPPVAEQAKPEGEAKRSGRAKRNG